MDPVALGRRGEERACEFLRELGYVIIARNFSVRDGEIDIIAWDNDVLVFVEVKSSTHTGVQPLVNVDEIKMKRLASAADQFVQRFGLEKTQARFDVIAITPERVQHIKDAFRPDTL